jgi:hypothetical protein
MGNFTNSEFIIPIEKVNLELLNDPDNYIEIERILMLSKVKKTGYLVQ